MKQRIPNIAEFINNINEGSDITPERMLRSVYDNLKDNVKSIVVEKIDTTNLTFKFTMNDIVSGSVEARHGKILISFDKLVIQPQQYDLVYDGETVLTKDYVRNEVSRIIGRFYDKVNKVR